MIVLFATVFLQDVCRANEPLRATHAMVVCASPEAAQIGADIMRGGGNAFDAATAVGFALAVTWPEAGNLGGGGLMVAVRHDGTAITLDFREAAPAGAHRDMYLDENGDPVEGLSLRSALASGVPGSVDGLLRIWRDQGSGNVSRRGILAPAIDLAKRGFPISGELADSFNRRRDRFSEDPGAAKIFIRGDGRAWAAGDLFVQPDLAATLRRIARHGRDGFYSGKVAELLAEQQARTGGVITRADLAAYRSIYRPPVTGAFRDYTVVSMGPPSSGGIMLIQMLNMLAGFPVEKLHWGSAEYAHLLTEVQRRAYADRAEHLGDADYWDVPIAALISPQYARRRAAEISTTRATPSAEIFAGDVQRESADTTHFSIVDSAGNAVALTTTMNASYGSGIVIDGAGFLMNNEMDDFSVKPGAPNLYGVTGGAANAIAPGKRMLSSMTPTVILQNGRPRMVLGSPGGATIITTVLQVFLNVALHDMNIHDAVDAPRHHSQWLPDVIAYEEGALSESERKALETAGHAFREPPIRIGAANCILIDQDGVLGAPDARRQSAAAGF